jgi:nucleotide-binding universal stress UspA family protein
MKTILVPIDFSDATPRVLDAARELAGAFAAKIVLLHVSEPEPDFVGFEPGPIAVRATIARDFKKEHQQLDAARTQLGDGLNILALHIQGPIVDKIIAEAQQHSADFIVLGSHGHGALFELLVGSVATGVLRNAGCPVLVVPVK